MENPTVGLFSLSSCHDPKLQASEVDGLNEGQVKKLLSLYVRPNLCVFYITEQGVHFLHFAPFRILTSPVSNFSWWCGEMKIDPQVDSPLTSLLEHVLGMKSSDIILEQLYFC